MIDPIVDEVRRVRDAYAARFDYDLDAMFRDIKEQERKSGLTYVSLVPPHASQGGPLTVQPQYKESGVCDESNADPGPASM